MHIKEVNNCRKIFRKSKKGWCSRHEREILRVCSATSSDVTWVLTELMDVMRGHLLNSEEVSVDGFGIFTSG